MSSCGWQKLKRRSWRSSLLEVSVPSTPGAGGEARHLDNSGNSTTHVYLAAQMDWPAQRPFTFGCFLFDAPLSTTA